jgi:phosphoribosylanthranilate isomerase
MKIKVCGMRSPQNIHELVNLSPDMIGFIFYEGSLRNVDQNFTPNFPEHIRKVGVFVNATVDFICEKAVGFRLDYIQLHGNESPEFCKELAERGFKLIKAFSVFERFEFSVLAHYEPYCDYFLFDTRGKLPGGNGEVFNWNLLKKYEGTIPFFLSGGIDLQHIERIIDIQAEHPKLVGIDVNSRFEISPAMKDISKVNTLLNAIQKQAITV